MLRRMKVEELGQVLEIWEAENLRSHFFVAPEYWQENRLMVAEAMQRAELWVCVEEGEVKGFLGIEGENILGLFVRRDMQGQGIGARLLDEMKRRHRCLRLEVYEQNVRAFRFYQREGFRPWKRQLDLPTQAWVWTMVWKREGL